MICSRCGYEIDDQAVYCPYCGQSIARAARQERQESAEEERYSQQTVRSESAERYENADRAERAERSARYEGAERTDRPERTFRSAPYPGVERSPQGTGYMTRPRPPRISLEDLPPELKPMCAWAYVGWGILFALPIAGFILVIIFSCVSGNINRKRFARSFLCWWLIIAIVITILALLGVVTWNRFINGDYWSFLNNPPVR